MFLTQQAVRSCALRIIVDGDPRLLESQRHVRLRHAEDGDLGKGIVLDQKVEDGIESVFVPQLGKYLRWFCL